MTFTRTLDCLRAELRDTLREITGRPHGLDTLRRLLNLSVLLNELEGAHDREMAERDRELELERTVADVIPLFGRHDVD